MRIQTNKEATLRKPLSRRQPAAGFTLVEVTMSLAIIGMVFGGILMAYVKAGKRAEWSGYSLAAQAYGIQQLEQARSATWDISSTTVVNDITNLNLINWSFSGNVLRGYTWTNLDIPYSGGNFIRVTNYVMITNMGISTTPLVSVHMVQVDTVWRYQNKNVTNRMVNYYAPDQ